jgi:hypothetical protein
MGYQQKTLLIIITALVALALYFALSTEVEEPPAETAEVKSLLMKGIGFGKGQENYVYSYNKISDGYKTTYVLTKSGDEGVVEVQNPLSLKRIYFLSNDTILCISYPVEETCSSVKNDARMGNYLDSLETEFFDDSRIDRNKADMEYLLEHGYAKLEPETRNKTIGNAVCTEMTYSLDYQNVSLSEAARFGISSSSPRLFMRTMCINNETGYRNEETLNYSFEEMMHTYKSQLLSFKAGPAGTITPPENLSEGAVDVLFQERTQQLKLAECFTSKEGEEREKCVSTIALQLRRKDICEVAGTRRDRCMVSIIPVTKDETICTAINDPSYKDDCYIELAGAYKNSTYCSNIQDASKIAYCMEVASPPEEPLDEGTPEDNETMNDSASNESEMDILDFMEYIDEEGSGNQTGTNESNSTG